MQAFTEKLLVEDYLIAKLAEKNWVYKHGDKLERDDYAEPLLITNLTTAIKRVNPNIELTENDVRFVLTELKTKPANASGTKKILEYLKTGVPLKLEKTRELRYIQLIDYDDVERNEFIVSNQVEFESARGRKIPDIVLFVNGIPLVVIEAKNPADPNVSWLDAYGDIKKYYEEIIPELFKYAQFGVAAAETAKYFPNVLGSRNVKIEEWRAEKTTDAVDAAIEMLAPATLLDLIRNFVFAREERGEANKVIARWMQFEAANQIYERVVKNLAGEETKNSGLVWHWQGSGKTLTMIFAAYKLYRHPALSNPTIFFVVDRDELQEQLDTEFSALDLPNLARPEVIDSISGLKEVLTHDGGRGKRGLFIVLIQKFRSEDLAQLKEFLKEKGESILNRKNVVAFVDEGHRTQYGGLALQMREILSHAFFFAFTGTPIAKEGRDTYNTFSYPRVGEKYLHKYFIRDSISDKFTVPIVLQTKLDKTINLDKDLLEAFIQQDFEEIPDSLQESVEKRVSKKLSDIVVRLKNPERIKFIAGDAAKHFKENVDGKFKAMVVAVDRAACVAYKNALDEFLPPNYSEVVMTFDSKKDVKNKDVTTFFDGLRKRYNGKQLWEIKREVTRNFKEEEYPKLLVVTDMLLTGFDAPILQTIYLDKPLKGHRLLQALARVNRPFKSVKEAGLVVDYVGILRDYEKALAMYDKEDVRYAASDLKDEVKRLAEKIKECEELLKPVNSTRVERESPRESSRDSLVKASRILLEDDKKANAFTEKYRDLRKSFAFLGLSQTNDFLSEFKWLTAVYVYYCKLTRRSDEDEIERYARDYFDKALKAVYESVEVSKVLKEFPEVEFNENYLENLKKTYSDEEERVYNMMFSLHRFVLVEKRGNPVFESIADKVEKIIAQWKEKKLEVKEAYRKLEKAFEEFYDIEDGEKQTGLSKGVYYALVILENKFGKSRELLFDVKAFEGELKKAGLLFEGWNRKQAAVKEIGRFVRKFLIKYKLPIEERNALYDKIIKGLKETD